MLSRQEFSNLPAHELLLKTKCNHFPCIKSIQVCIFKFSLPEANTSTVWVIMSGQPIVTTSCGMCGKNTTVPGHGKPNQCSKCRKVTYCNLDCQKEHWETHKRGCKPIFAFTMTKLFKDHAAGDWKKVMKYRGALDQILQITSDMVGRDEMTMHKDRIRILAMFVDAHKQNMAQNQSMRQENEALGLCYVLEQCILSQVKTKDYEGAGLSMCDIASFAQIVPVDKIPPGDDTFFFETNFKAAALLGRTRGISSVVAQACLGLGQIAMDNDEIDKAEGLMKEAFVGAAKIQHSREVQICLALADIYLVKGKIDRADWFVKRTSRLLEEDSRGDYITYSPMHLANHLYKIRIHEARGEISDVASDLCKFVMLVRSNLADIVKWRLMLQMIILQSFGTLTTLDKLKGNEDLIAMMTQLANQTGTSLELLDLLPKNKLLKFKYV
jgi:hypothetical protein